MVNIVFDLDGTLIDSSERMFRLFQKLIPESTFSKEEYWNLKRRKVNHQMILSKYFPDYDYERFNKIWLDYIERIEYLELDRNYSDTITVLKKLNKRYNIILLTARQVKDRLYKELNSLGLFKYLHEVLVTEAKETKEELLLKHEGKNFIRTNKDLFVSDMGKDISIGNKLGYLTVAITHGFMSYECLIEYSPKYIINELCELETVLEQIRE